MLAAGGGALSTFAAVRSDCPDCGDVGTFDLVDVELPEPTTTLLFGTSLAGIAGAARRRRRHTA